MRLLPAGSAASAGKPPPVFEPPSAWAIRESFRQSGKVKNRTLANLSNWCPGRIEALRRFLRGEFDQADALSLAPHAITGVCSKKFVFQCALTRPSGALDLWRKRAFVEMDAYPIRRSRSAAWTGDRKCTLRKLPTRSLFFLPGRIPSRIWRADPHSLPSVRRGFWDMQDYVRPPVDPGHDTASSVELA